MRTGEQRPTIRSSTLVHALATLLALGAFTACAAEVKGPSEEDAREAGRSYGETLVDTIGARATREELENLCGQGAKDEGIVTEGRQGDETDLEIDAFVDGCLEVVTAE